jgi:hypothetical protein
VSVLLDKPVDHGRTIAFLAEEAHVSVEEVERLYEHERAGFESTARIKGFVPILIIRNVRDVLRHRPKVPIASPKRDIPIAQ